MIFKVQRALVSTVDEPPMLVYNEDRSLQFEISDISYLAPDRHKFFVDADILDRQVGKRFCIKGVVEDADW